MCVCCCVVVCGLCRVGVGVHVRLLVVALAVCDCVYACVRLRVWLLCDVARDVRALVGAGMCVRVGGCVHVMACVLCCVWACLPG